MIFVDTNYFLRFLIRDNEIHFAKSRELFEKGARGEIKLFSSAIVFFEIYWVLSSFYQKKKQEISEILRDILQLVFIEFENRKILEEALKIFEKTGLDFEDSYNVAFYNSRYGKEFKTFDGKLMKYLDN